MQNFDQEQTQFVHHQLTHISFSVSILIKQKMKTSASESVRFFEILTVLRPNPSLRRTERVRHLSASVLFGRYFIGPWSASVLEADVSEKKLPSRVLYRPASASVPGQSSPSRNPCHRKKTSLIVLHLFRISKACIWKA